MTANDWRYRIGCSLAGVLLLLWAGASSAGLPPEARLAAPLLTQFGPDDYGAHGQNWGFEQLDDGRMLVANNRGVVVYDGARFKLIVAADGINVHALHQTASGRIFVVGAYELGELRAGADGTLAYSRLVSEDVFGTGRRLESVLIDDVLWLMAERALHRFGPSGLETIHEDASGKLLQLFAMSGRPVVLHRDRGLVDFARAGGKVLLDHPLLHQDGRIRVQPFGDGHIVLGVSGSGLRVTHSDGEWFAHSLAGQEHWDSASEMLANARVQAVLTLRDGRLAVATVRAGVFVFDSAGRLNARIDTINGLAVDTVAGLAEDREGGLWIATLDGFARAELHLPYRRLDDRHNLRSVVHALLRYRGELWAATSSGVLRWQGRMFQPVEGITDQVWSIGVLTGLGEPDGLLIASDAGLLHWQPDRVTTVLERLQAYHLRRQGEGHWLLGHGRGLLSVCWTGERWQAVDLPVVEGATRSLVADADGVVWAGTLVHAAYRIEGLTSTCPVGADQLEVTRFGTDRGLPASNYAEVYDFGGEIRVGTRLGIYRPDPGGERLVPDTDFESRFHDGSLGWFTTAEDAHGRIQAQMLDGDGRWTEILERRADGRFHALLDPLARLSDSRAEGYFTDGDGFWMHGARRIEWVGALGSHPAPGVQPLLEARTAGAGDGYGLGEGPLSRDRSSLEFRFALPLYDFSEGRQWRSRLAGFDEDWSDWTAVDFRNYTNLPGGSYRFEVQARDGFGHLSPVTSLAFEVARAGYLSLPALVGWALLAAALLLLTARLGRATLAVRNRQLEALVAERTAEIRNQRDRLATMAYQDALTRLPNRRAMYRRLTAELERAHERGDPVTLMAIDLNEFKQTNDRFGHSVGDEVLRRVAAILVRVAGADNPVFRLGGDEFVVLCSGQSVSAALECGQAMVDAVSAARFDDLASGLRAAIAVGVASMNGPRSWELVLELADQALYQAKQQGSAAVVRHCAVSA